VRRIQTNTEPLRFIYRVKDRRQVTDSMPRTGPLSCSVFQCDADVGAFRRGEDLIQAVALVPTFSRRQTPCRDHDGRRSQARLCSVSEETFHSCRERTDGDIL